VALLVELVDQAAVDQALQPEEEQHQDLEIAVEVEVEEV
jgi:hypothetical protein